MVKNLSYVKISSISPSYLSINKIDGYIEESNRTKCLTLAPTDETKNILKSYEELQNKIRDLVRPITNNSESFDGKFTKVKFNSDDDLPLKNSKTSYHGNSC